MRAKYVVGADGARSGVREAIGAQHVGAQAFHAWGVMDALAVTDFPDIRTKCSIQSEAGNILLIPREGGFLFRMYVDLGEVPPDDQRRGAQDHARRDHREGERHPAPVPPRREGRARGTASTRSATASPTGSTTCRSTRSARATPRVFIAGDACHTHSAKAGQGMNVSMQDGWNLGWKLGQVLSGLSPETLLATYSAERQVVAQNLIDFDKEWSTLMAKKPEEFESPSALEDFYVSTAEFPAGFMTQYQPSMIVGDGIHQALATGFPIGKRFKSARVARVADGNDVHLGHHHRADGRWRVYAFADAAPAGGRVGAGATGRSGWRTRPSRPLAAYTPDGRGSPTACSTSRSSTSSVTATSTSAGCPACFLPASGPFELIDYEKVYARRSRTRTSSTLRGIDRARVRRRGAPRPVRRGRAARWPRPTSSPRSSRSSCARGRRRVVG